VSAVTLPADVLARLAAEPRLLVVCDFDGTLAPIVADPAAARPHLAAMAALIDLAQQPGTTVALVSGRSLADLARLSGAPAGVRLVGSHGAEFDHDVVRALDADALVRRAALATAVDKIVRGTPGVLVEHKPAGVAVHVRNASRPDAARVLEAVRRGPAQLAGVHATAGKEVLELSVVPTSKGAAIAELRGDLAAGAVLFVGDDVTDETGFAVLIPGDVGVKVGTEPSLAQYEVDSPTAVAELLDALAERRAAGR
jgi:trehalose 6-phosphate phosphatase